MNMISDIYATIADLTAEETQYVINARRHLHQVPELGFAEIKTAAFIAEELKKMGLEPKTGIATTGVTARLDFAKPGPCLMIRADMDALPVEEDTGLEYASTHAGYMHACGHDGHVAILLGAAKVMTRIAKSEFGKELSGSILFLFQPAEESPGGAEPMIKAGVLQGVDYCLACHIWPETPEGYVGIRKGPLMAAMDRFDITLHGKGGHGSQPHLCTDTLDAAAQLTCALQHIVSRRISPVLPAALTVGCLQAGDTFNVIPQTALIMGCTRAFHGNVIDAWKGHIEQVTKGICDSIGVSFELDFKHGHGPVNNDETITTLVSKAAAEILGEKYVIEPEMSLAGEDFACYQEVIPGCMFFLGAGTAHCKPLHSPNFTFNEKILDTGVKVFCGSALKILAS